MNKRFNIFNRNKRKIKCVAKYHTMYGDGDELEVGKIYTLVRLDVHQYNTDVYIEEIPDKPFNSVFFEEIEEE